MPKSLFVVESPAKARTITRYLGPEFVVKATVGHIKDLPKNELGVKIEEGFIPTYQILKGKQKIVTAIRRAAKGVDTVYIACDPDREGEAIAWHVAQEIKKGFKKGETPPMKRVLVHEITRRGIWKALKNPAELDRKKYESQVARRVLDRLVGYELSPLLWKKLQTGLSAGRVQSVAVALVVDREREILDFQPKEYWEITAKLQGKSKKPFCAKLVYDGEKKLELTTQQQASPLADILKVAHYAVTKIEKETKERYPPPPYITSTLQQEANRRLKMSASETMRIAQTLYEGVSLGKYGRVGLITYMRTDSTRVAPEAIKEVREYIVEKFGQKFLPEKPNFFKSKKGAQEAHEAIRPTSMEFAPEKIKEYLDKKTLALYKLVWQRFVASQMKPALLEITTITIQANQRWIFEARGKRSLFQGFMKVYKPVEVDKLPSIAALEQGEVLTLLDLDCSQHFTSPPPRFTEATLIRELERQGIGRPSTYATILSTIQEKKYVTKWQARFRPTELGFVVTDLLRNSFPTILDVHFTAQMEEALDKVEEGKTRWDHLLRAFWQEFSTALVTAKEQMPDLRKHPLKTSVKCPNCGHTMVIKFARYRAFLACSAYPECKTTLLYTRGPDGTITPIEEELSDKKCTNCNSPLVLKRGKYGKFWACSNYPQCKFTQPYTTNLPCPNKECTGQVVQKRSKKGRTFYTCTNSPTCNFVMFGKITRKECPKCSNQFLEERRRGNTVALSCPNPDCDYHEKSLAKQRAKT